eukprot:352461-Rhodomonas_salina.6
MTGDTPEIFEEKVISHVKEGVKRVKHANKVRAFVRFGESLNLCLGNTTLGAVPFTMVVRITASMT